MPIILEAIDIKKDFGGLSAVNVVTFQIEENSITSIIGPNGAGKTTTFNLLSGVIQLTSGIIRMNGKIISGLKPNKIAGFGMVRTFQNVQLFSNMNAIENIMVGRHLISKSGFISSAFKMPWTFIEERNIRKKAEELLEFIGLSDIRNTPSTSLPFGKQRLLEIARAVAAEPKILLLDEPAAGLNTKETIGLGGLIKKLRSMGITIVLVEHDMELVMDISDKVIVLDHGEKIAEGTPNEVQTNQRVISAYLGEEDKEEEDNKVLEKIN